MYKPLPECVTIKQSSIDGLGLFSTCDIKANETIGITHVLIPNDSFLWHKDLYSTKYQYSDSWARTPLGGFYNHNSNNPTCWVKDIQIDNRSVKVLIALRDIKEGEELTAVYSLYNPEVEK